MFGSAVLNDPYVKIVISSVSVYLFILVAIRLFGKKELAQLSVVDLVFILLISNSVQNAMVGNNTSLPGGLVAAASLFAVNYLFKYVLYRFPRLGRWMQGEAVLLIYRGRVIREALERTRLSLDELNEAVREHGVGTIGEVDLAVLEMDGNISILSDQFRRRTSRQRKARRAMSRQGR
jgi:uncharacterized membrane protein YcaP (DUF421 family)